MPEKKIYIRPESMTLFAEAETYGNSFSKVVEEALRAFVEEKRLEGGADGFALISLDIGRLYPEPAELKTIQFRGRHLITEKISDSDGESPYWETWALYQTKKNKILIWLQEDEERIEVESTEQGETVTGEMIDIPQLRHTWFRSSRIIIIDNSSELLSNPDKERITEVFVKRRTVKVKEIQVDENTWIRRSLLERAYKSTVPRKASEVLDI